MMAVPALQRPIVSDYRAPEMAVTTRLRLCKASASSTGKQGKHADAKRPPQPTGGSLASARVIYCFVSSKLYGPSLSRPAPDIFCFPSLVVRVSSAFPCPAVVV